MKTSPQPEQTTTVLDSLADPLVRLRDLFLVPRRRTEPGSPPGLLVADPAARSTIVRAITFSEGELWEGSLESAEDAAVRREEGTVVWIDVQGLADADTIRGIGEAYGLHRLALEDVLNVHQRPKLESYADHLFLVMRMPGGPEAGGTEQVSLFIGDGFVLTFQEGHGDRFDPVRERLRAGRGSIRRRGADYLAYALVDAIVDGYFPVLEALGERLETVEDEVVTRPSRGSVRRIHALKRELLATRRAVWPLRDALHALVREPEELIAEDTRIHLRDCADHVFQLIDLLETYREIGSGLMDVYLSSLGNRTNEIMKVLTIFAAIFIPLTFIAGVYGMNFDPEVSPWNMPELGWRYGYPFALGVMALTVAGLLLYFRRKGWLGG